MKRTHTEKQEVIELSVRGTEGKIRAYYDPSSPLQADIIDPSGPQPPVTSLRGEDFDLEYDADKNELRFASKHETPAEKVFEILRDACQAGTITAIETDELTDGSHRTDTLKVWMN
jgi:hypothetical protein